MSDISLVGDFYMTIDEACDEVKRRRSDTVLQEKIRAYFGSPLGPTETKDESFAVWAPTLATPNIEFDQFMKMCAFRKLKKMCLEYRNDKFVHINMQKRLLGEMTFCTIGDGGKIKITEVQRMIDFEEWQGKKLSTIVTRNGENFVNFNHRLLNLYAPKNGIEVVDFSDWFVQSRTFNMDLPYMRYMSLFMSNAILFTNFTTEKYESEFTKKIVRPTFLALRDLFGINPMIVPLEPLATDEIPVWCYYSDEVRKLI